MSKKMRIISFDGGGIKGITSLCILRRLMQHRPELLTEVDLVAGTSTGGIIALMLAAGYDIEHTLKLYTEEGPKLFPRRWRHLFGLFGAKYHNKGLATALFRELKDYSLGDLQKKVLVPAVDLHGRRGAHQTVKGTFFHNFENSPYLTTPAWEVGMYTSAAPTFYESYRGYIDGGLVANNPCMAAVAQVITREAVPKMLPTNVVCLSIGTGFAARDMTDQEDFGIKDAATLVNILFNGLEESPAFLARAVLGDNFHRINPADTDCLAMDDTKNIGKHMALGDRCPLGDVLSWLDTHWQNP